MNRHKNTPKDSTLVPHETSFSFRCEEYIPLEFQMHELQFRVFFEHAMENESMERSLLYKGPVPRRNIDFVLPSGTWNIMAEFV